MEKDIVEYHIIKKAGQKGPLTLEALVSEKPDRKDMVWKTGLPAWIPAENLSELADYFKKIPPPFPPPKAEATSQPPPPPRQNPAPPPPQSPRMEPVATPVISTANGLRILVLLLSILGILGSIFLGATAAALYDSVFAMGSIRNEWYAIGRGEEIAGIVGGLAVGFFILSLLSLIYSAKRR